MTNFLASLSRTLVSRRGSWISLGILLAITAMLFGVLSGAAEDRPNESAPADSESARTSELLAEFPDADSQSVMVVASHQDGSALSAADIDELGDLAGTLVPATKSDSSPAKPSVSDDGEAALIMVPITVGTTNSDTADTVEALRTQIDDDATADQLRDNGITLSVTGGPAFGADIASAFSGADFTLLVVTIAIVAFLLILTYRSPILWLLPLLVIGTADGLASRVTTALGNAFDLQFDAGIISVLVFGAGANYALLLISRYREELRAGVGGGDHRAALASAWQHTATTIGASNLTVVLSLLSLALAVIPGTHGLGITAAAGLIVAAAAVLFALPPVLAICGPRVFWPFVPHPEEKSAAASTEDDSEADPAAADSSAARKSATRRAPRRSIWRAIAETVTSKPWRHLGAGVLILGVLAIGLVGTSVGLDQTEKFRVQSDSAEGFDVLADHFPPGEAQPLWVVTDTAHAKAVTSAAADVPTVIRAVPVAEAPAQDLTKIMVTSTTSPSSAENLDLVRDLRDAVHAVPEADALVGGASATELDARSGNLRDFLVVAPIVAIISALVLLLILRAPLAALVLLLLNFASAAAAIGAGSFLSRLFFDQPALDSQVPILAFLFLVALGIDYSIFIAHRARKETKVHGSRAGIVEAVAHTGGVITSAGIVLAGVFAALGTLPLLVLGQLGIIVGLGVLVDTLVVRTILVPAVFSLLGDRVWWPMRVPKAGADENRSSGADLEAGPEAEGEPVTSGAHHHSTPQH